MASSSSLKYILVDKEESDVTDAIAKLQVADKLAVDCEGMALSRDGELTLLTISTKEQAYVFDILKLGQKAFELGLKSLLENNHQTKLLFDCRGDSDALQHQFGVKLSGVLDLQIMEILYREEIGEFDITNKELQLAKNRGEIPIYLHGLKRCIENHVSNISFILAKGRVLPSTLRTVWKDRPLTDTLLSYATADVLSLFPLFDFFKARLSGNFMSRLQIASDTYLDFFRGKSIIGGQGDIFERNAFFPMYILPGKDGRKTDMGSGTKCSGCKRMLPSSFFDDNLGRRALQMCPVCKKAQSNNMRRLNRYNIY